MTSPRLLLLALSGLSVAACASTPAPTSGAGVAQGAPLPLADHDWFRGDDGVLRYGRDRSGDVWLSLACEPGTRRVDVAQWSHAVEAREIHLESGGETERWAASVEPDETGGDAALVTTAQADEPVFQRFRRLGWLASWGPEGRVMMAAQPGSLDRVERFFAACG